jgi:hypothetical protein
VSQRASFRQLSRNHLRRFLRSGRKDDQEKEQDLLARERWSDVCKEIDVEIGKVYQTKFKKTVESGNSKEIWEAINPKGKTPLISGLTLPQWEQHFKAINYKGNPELISPTTEAVNAELDAKISVDEMLSVINGKKSGKSPGSDKVNYDVWKKFCENDKATDLLLIALNQILDGEKIPDTWRITELIVLYKGKGAIDDPNSYRGISLSQSVVKIFETIIAKRLYRWAEENNILPPNQAGFRKGYATLDQIFVFSGMLRKHKEEKKNCIQH